MEVKTMKKKTNQIGNPIDIDLNNLEEEWANQPKMYGAYARRLARARKEHSIKEAELEKVESELAHDMRQNPSSYGMAGKASEAAIEKLIPLEKRYQKALRRVIEAKFVLDMADGKVRQMDHRKKALEKEVELFGMDYWSVPHVSSKVSIDAKQKIQEGERKSVRKPLKKKGKKRGQ